MKSHRPNTVAIWNKKSQINITLEYRYNKYAMKELTHDKIYSCLNRRWSTWLNNNIAPGLNHKVSHQSLNEGKQQRTQCTAFITIF